MIRSMRLRRVGILCCYFLKNMAFHKAGWRENNLIFKSEFCITANGNFLDICFLEWLKLFGDIKGKQSWQTVITNKDSFFNDLLKTIEMTEDEFNSYIKEMRTYRDKFVAHLDSETVAKIPLLLVALKSVSFLYDYLLANEEEDNCFYDAQPNAFNYYESMFSKGQLVYSQWKKEDNCT